MAKPEVITPALKERLPLKSTRLVVNRRDFANKSVIIHMDDSYTLQDIQDDRTLLRVIQKSRDKALNEGDSVELRWHDQIASTQVDYAEGDNATTLWQDANFEVRPVDGGYCYWRRKDNIRMTTALFPTWEAAKQACIRDQAGVRL